jgi:predicted phosphodiesterase
MSRPAAALTDKEIRAKAGDSPGPESVSWSTAPESCHPPLPCHGLRRRVPADFIRILSDLHFGDHASRVVRLKQVQPLLEGVSSLVLNGDTLDTRPGPHPAHTAECHAEVSAFFGQKVAKTTYLTGNHDPDLSPHHRLDLANGAVFVTHGDAFFDDIVPWSHDAPFIRQRLADEFARLPRELHDALDHRLAVFRRVALAIPQRHQSERNKLKYALHYLADTVWPPLRLWRVFRAWKQAPVTAAAFARQHRPRARFVISGHTHRPGIWSPPSGPTVINTGSFCPPLGGLCVDLTPERVIVRQIVGRGAEFRAGSTVAEFPLAAA